MAGRKLSLEQINEIKALKEKMDASGKPFVYSKIGKLYGVTGQTIRRNVAPTEYDMKPRPPVEYDPVVAKKRREACRAYQFYAYRNSAQDQKIINKLDSLPNKQQYIKDLILEDIESEEESESKE